MKKETKEKRREYLREWRKKNRDKLLKKKELKLASEEKTGGASEEKTGGKSKMNCKKCSKELGKISIMEWAYLHVDTRQKEKHERRFFCPHCKEELAVTEVVDVFLGE